METPPTLGHGTARLQQQLDAASSGQRLHRRAVSRNVPEDAFFTPKASPQARTSLISDGEGHSNQQNAVNGDGTQGFHHPADLQPVNLQQVNQQLNQQTSHQIPQNKNSPQSTQAKPQNNAQVSTKPSAHMGSPGGTPRGNSRGTTPRGTPQIGSQVGTQMPLGSPMGKPLFEEHSSPLNIARNGGHSRGHSGGYLGGFPPGSTPGQFQGKPGTYPNSYPNARSTGNHLGHSNPPVGMAWDSPVASPPPKGLDMRNAPSASTSNTQVLSNGHKSHNKEGYSKQDEKSQGSASSKATSGGRALSRRICSKCNQDITGHFVRALDQTFHIDCFTCEDCSKPCAAKFFPLDNKPLCERCYFKRQNLLCYRCNNSLRGSYITALDRKYHVDHFTCSMCTTVFGPEDSYFEFDGEVYCRTHYSALYAFRCEGCKSPILKQFVETYRGGRQQQWHPECYMIFKFWSVKIADKHADEIAKIRDGIAQNSNPKLPLDLRSAKVITHEEMVDKRTMRTWTILCGFEESCAECISGLVQDAYLGEFKAAHQTCAKLVAYIKVLFSALDSIPTVDNGEYKEPGREAKTLCRKVVSYMSLLSRTRQQDQKERIQSLSNDLLPLASAISHYLKVLIRQGISGALNADILDQFLSSVSNYSTTKSAKSISPFSTDRCLACGNAVEDRCYRQREYSDRMWHARSQCFKCSETGKPLDPNNAAITLDGKLVSLEAAPPGLSRAHFSTTTKLEQYIILLHVALARLNLVLSSNRAKSQDGSPTQSANTSQMSSSAPILSEEKKTKQKSPDPGFDAPAALKRASTILNQKAGLTLDDIRRIVATEQSRSKHVKDKAAAKSAEKSSKSTSSSATNVSGTPSTSTIPLSSGMYYGNLSDNAYGWTISLAQALLQPYMAKYMKREGREAISGAGYMSAALVNPGVTPSSLAGAYNASNSRSQGNIWNRMGKVFAMKESESKESKVFGQPLDVLVAKYGVDSSLAGSSEQTVESESVGTGPRYTLRIPGFVDDCISAMRQKDMSVEGIFRKNGNIRRIREFTEKIDKNPDENGLLVEETPIQLAALLKKFLRELPDPLMTSKLTVLWAAVGTLQDPQEKIRLCQLLVSVMPRPNRNLLEILVYFLNWVASFAHVDDESGSKMDTQNLATVLGPTIAMSREEASAGNMEKPAMLDSNVKIGNVEAFESDAMDKNTSSSSIYKSVSDTVKLMISDYSIVSQLPTDIAAAIKRLSGPPRSLTFEEATEIIRKSRV